MKEFRVKSNAHYEAIKLTWEPFLITYLIVFIREFSST